MVAAGWIGAEAVTVRLLDAAHACGLVADDGEQAARATIRSGLNAGMAHPHAPLAERGGDETSRTGADVGNSNASILSVRADTVEQRPVEWLWANRMARGKQTLLGGDPGLGKSQISIDAIARITRQGSWPDGGIAPDGNCLILSAEDADADTICPRLEVAGADLSRVHIIKSIEESGNKRSFSLARDLNLLATKIEQVGDVAMIVIDPITAYMGGGIDSHRTTDVRSVLEPFEKFADRYRCGILSITHPPKAAQAKAINAFTGSLAFVAAARIVLVALEEVDTDRRLLLGVKNNLGPMPSGIGYRLATKATLKGIVAPGVIWDSQPVYVTANEAIHAVADEASKSGARQKAGDFLKGYLETGAMPADDVKAAADANGIAERTLRRARDDLKIVVEKSGYAGGWIWRLP
jgi:hypothetical protein